MGLSPAQIKGRIKSLAAKSHADASALMRIYMMERFLERIAMSEHKDCFIIKGGILVTAMVGVAMRSTLDIDTTIINFELNEENAFRIIKEICSVQLDDGVSFSVTKVESTMDEMEYPGIRLHLDSLCGGLKTPIKIDISTGDVITPRAIDYHYKLMLEEKYISLWSYNLETVIAEKLQTILARDDANTRMRDFYDVNMLFIQYKDRIDPHVLEQAYAATCKKRGTLYLINNWSTSLKKIAASELLVVLWENYQAKYQYASGITYSNVIESIWELFSLMKRNTSL